jgi:chromate transport protein ChrA
MSSVLRGIWDNTYGLLVDDGQLAIGAILALVIAWLVSQASDATLHDNAGWVLLVLVVALVIANLYRAGHNARRRMKPR